MLNTMSRNSAPAVPPAIEEWLSSASRGAWDARNWAYPVLSLFQSACSHGDGFWQR